MCWFVEEPKLAWGRLKYWVVWEGGVVTASAFKLGSVYMLHDKAGSRIEREVEGKARQAKQLEPILVPDVNLFSIQGQYA